VTAQQALAFVVFSVAAAGTPGSSNALLAATGAKVGVARGLPTLLGVAVGMGLMMFAVAFGLGTVILDAPIVSTGVKACGAAFLLWLAWKIATAGRPGAAAADRPIGFVGAAAFQWINPKSWLVSASAASTFLSAGAGSPLSQAAWLGGLFVLAALPSCFLWLAFGAAVQHLLDGGRRLRVFNVVMGALLALSVVLIVR
jgi:threonine/homoserine/homoserine lactone efflux protein